MAWTGYPRDYVAVRRAEGEQVYWSISAVLRLQGEMDAGSATIITLASAVLTP